MDFTYESYRNLISLLKEYNFTITNYHEYHQVEKPCILRHDVDMSIEKAVEFAELENKIDVQSTYFLLINSDFYNLYSIKNKKNIKKILEYGHEIGLHFDEKDCERDMIKNRILSEKQLLENMLDVEIKTVSMHRPTEETLKANYKINGIVNSYGKEFFQNFKYVSDSRMFWREEVEGVIRNTEIKKLHILTHPFWYGTQKQGTREKLLDFIRKASKERYSSVDENFRNLEEFILDTEI